jgi:hypothetical protein
MMEQNLIAVFLEESHLFSLLVLAKLLKVSGCIVKYGGRNYSRCFYKGKKIEIIYPIDTENVLR